MLPIVFDVKTGPIVLVGEGDLVVRRLALLEEAQSDVLVFSRNPSDLLIEQAGERLTQDRPSESVLAKASLIFGAGLEPRDAEELASTARKLGVLVNIEDVKSLCDFHVPSMVRRGDLTVTISTGGKSPGLAKRLRGHLEHLFGVEWSDRVEAVAELRDRWRADGLPLKEISQKTDNFIDQQGWLS